MQTLASLQQFVHRLVGTKFEQNVDILVVLKKMVKLCHVLVSHTAVNLNFTHELLLGPTFGETFLVDDLGSLDLLGVGILEFEASGKTSLAQKLASDVLSDSCVATVLLFQLFFNDDWLLLHLDFLHFGC
jgi:hypothetical protein